MSSSLLFSFIVTLSSLGLQLTVRIINIDSNRFLVRSMPMENLLLNKRQCIMAINTTIERGSGEVVFLFILIVFLRITIYREAISCFCSPNNHVIKTCLV